MAESELIIEMDTVKGSLDPLSFTHKHIHIIKQRIKEIKLHIEHKDNTLYTYTSL